MIYIFNHDEIQIDSIDVDVKIVREIGKLNTLEFEYDVEYEKGYRVTCYIDNKLHEFIIDEIDYSRDDYSNFYYRAVDSLRELEGSFIQEKRPSGNFNHILTEIMKNERWELKVLPDYNQDAVKSMSFYQISTFEAISRIINEFNIEFFTEFEGDIEITKRSLVIGQIGKKSNQVLEFGKNIINFERKIIPGLVITALKAYGKGEELEGGGHGRRINFSDINNGKDYVENLEALNKFGIGKAGNKKHVFGKIIIDDEEDKENLLQIAKGELKRLSQVNAEYEVQAVDIEESIFYGDEIVVIDEEINFIGETRIIKEERHADEVTYTFGQVSKTFTDSIKDTIKEETDLIKTEVSSIIERELKNVNLDYFNEDGYTYDLKAGNKYNLPAGIYSFDKPIEENPTKLIYVGAGKVLISNEKGTDGAWIWQTAITGDGIFGSTLTTGSVTANKLAPDVGQGLDLSSNEYIQSIVSNNSDISDEVYKKISELNNLLEDKISESTINELLEEINNQLNVNSTKINQNENKLEIEFESIKAEVDNNRADLNTLTSTITSGQDDDGNSYTEWGSTGDAKVRVGANGIDIISNDQEVMRFKDGEAYAKALYVTETIGFGNHIAQKYGTIYTIFSPNSEV